MTGERPAGGQKKWRAALVMAGTAAKEGAASARPNPLRRDLVKSWSMIGKSA